MQRRLWAIGAGIALLVLLQSLADARPRRSFGLGIIFFEPTGLSFEARFARRQSIDIAVGFDTFDNDENTYVHVEYLVKPFDLGRSRSLTVPLYLGVGGFFREHGPGEDLGVRVPFGLALEFRAPLQVFFEVALRATLADSDHDHGDDIDVDGAVGFRLLF
jgi:hypothetical protein